MSAGRTIARITAPIISIPLGFYWMGLMYDIGAYEAVLELPMVIALPLYILMMAIGGTVITSGIIFAVYGGPSKSQQTVSEYDQLRAFIDTQLDTLDKAVTGRYWANEAWPVDRLLMMCHDNAERLRESTGEDGLDQLRELRTDLDDLMVVVDDYGQLVDSADALGDEATVTMLKDKYQAAMQGFYNTTRTSTRLRHSASSADVIDRAERLTSKGSVTPADLETKLPDSD